MSAFLYDLVITLLRLLKMASSGWYITLWEILLILTLFYCFWLVLMKIWGLNEQMNSVDVILVSGNGCK